MDRAGSPESRRPIAILVSSLAGGGAQRAMVMLARGLADRGHPVDFIASQAVGPFLEDLPRSVRLVDLAAPRVLRALPRLVRYLRRERPRALISALDYVNVVAIVARDLARTGTPVVITEQNTPSALAPNTRTWRAQNLPRLIRLFYPRADRVIAVSEGVHQDLTDNLGVPEERVEIIYHAVLGSELRKRSQEPLDHPWFQEGAPPAIVAVGRLDRQKDYPTLLHAFARVRSQRDARLVILGEGPLRAETEALVAELGLANDVELPGFVRNPYAFLSRARVFALSSLCEGLPTVVIEALYCGANLVCTDCPSGPREILQGDRYGRLVPVGDVPALADALRAALDEERATPPREAWHPYTVDAVAQEYEALLERLAAGS
jgi:glycosyltransferase involved in cell wall biosynthesis